jgi:N4-gp56 family major capsid protein
MSVIIRKVTNIFFVVIAGLRIESNVNHSQTITGEISILHIDQDIVCSVWRHTGTQETEIQNIKHVTDVVDLTVEDSTLTEAASLLGEQMGLTLDTLTRDILCACASIYSCVSGTNAKTPTNITKTDIDIVVKTLLGANAKMITEVLKASSGVGTTPVRPAFWALAHTDLIDTIETCTGFLHHANYPAQNDVQEGEWGSIGNVRFLLSTNADRTTGNPGVYRIPVIGRDAYGISRIEQGTAKNIVKGYGSGGTSDPLDQRTTSGWKCWHVARILNDSFMLLMRASNSTSGA